MAQEATEHPLHLQNQKNHASTKISAYMIMYGRVCVMPWELEGDLRPKEDEEDQDILTDEVIERMYNIREQVLNVATASIKRAQKIQARSYNAKHCRNAFEVGEEAKHDVVRSAVCNYIIQPDSWYKLKHCIDRGITRISAEK